jgi:ribose 5-phosphate isomerase B
MQQPVSASFSATLPVAIGSDHAGFEYKSHLISCLQQQGLQYRDFGTFSAASVDYPDIAHPLATDVENGEAAWGILLCGSANGVAITANKHAGIRAAICWTEELAELARKHNDANVLCLPARFIDLALAEKIMNAFFRTAFEGGRHAARIGTISC